MLKAFTQRLCRQHGRHRAVVAIHEATHAVVHAALGGRVSRVTISRDGSGVAQVFSDDLSTLDNVAMTVAPHRAALMFGFTRGSDRTDYRDDLSMVYDNLRSEYGPHLNPFETHTFWAACGKAERIINRHQTPIAQCAALLAVKFYMDGKRVHAIVDETQRTASEWNRQAS